MAVEGLLRSQLMSETTRKQLELFLTELDGEIVAAVRTRLKDDNSAAD
jgi:hypothetical protein